MLKKAGKIIDYNKAKTEYNEEMERRSKKAEDVMQEIFDRNPDPNGVTPDELAEVLARVRAVMRKEEL